VPPGPTHLRHDIDTEQSSSQWCYNWIRLVANRLIRTRPEAGIFVDVRLSQVNTVLPIVTALIAVAGAIVAIWQAILARTQARNAERVAMAAEEQVDAAHRQAAAAEQAAAAAVSQLEHDRVQMALSFGPKFSLAWAEGYLPPWEDWEQFVLTYDQGPGELDRVNVSVRSGNKLDGLLLRSDNTKVSSFGWNHRFPGHKMVFEAHLGSGGGEVVVDIVANKGAGRRPPTLTWASERSQPSVCTQRERVG
jgi:hypothetical protein